jgi:hypothetical protein
MKIKKALTEAAEPSAKPEKVYHDWHDDAIKIVALLESKAPEHQKAIAKLYADCPHKYSCCTTTGKKIAVRAHTVAAWAGKQPEILQRLKARSLI